MEPIEANKEFLRWFLLIGAAPVWVPFLLALWRDFSRALREEGGLFGREPGAAEVEALRRARESEPDTLVSEPWVRRGERRMPRLGAKGPAAGAPPRRPPGFRNGPGAPGLGGRRGFR